MCSDTFKGYVGETVEYKDVIKEVPGFKVEWYAVFEVTPKDLKLLYSENIDSGTLEKLNAFLKSAAHDMKTISDRELISMPIQERKIDVIASFKNGLLTMTLLSEQVFVIAKLSKVNHTR